MVPVAAVRDDADDCMADLCMLLVVIEGVIAFIIKRAPRSVRFDIEAIVGAMSDSHQDRFATLRAGFVPD